MFLEIHVSIGVRPRAKAKMKRDAMHLLGNRGDAIKRVSADTRKALMDTFLCDVSLKVHVKAPPKEKYTKPSENQDQSTDKGSSSKEEKRSRR